MLLGNSRSSTATFKLGAKLRDLTLRANNFFVRAARKNVFSPVCRPTLELSKMVKKVPGKSRNQKLEVPKYWSKIGQNVVTPVKPDAKVPRPNFEGR